MKRSKPFEGKVVIGFYSSLRKRMRAARRGLLIALVPTQEDRKSVV